MNTKLTMALVGAGLLAVTASPSLGADMLIAPEQQAIPAYEPIESRFSGGYLGLNISIAETVFKKNCHALPTFNQLCQSPLIDYGPVESGTSVGFGVRLGYDWQFSNLVIGALGDFDYYGSDNSGLDYLASLRGRVGFNPVDDGLLYVSGGVALGSFRDSSINAFPYGTASVTGDSSSTGLVIGAGYEHKLTQNISAFGEFNYYQFSDASLTSSPMSPADPVTNDANIKQIKLGVNWRF